VKAKVAEPPSLAKAVERALTLSRAACCRYAQDFSWEAATRQFLFNLAPVAQ